MGRIKTTFIKRKTKEILKLYGKNFSTEFQDNKPLVSQHAIIQSKKLRNVIAGYVTRLKRKVQ